MTEHNGTFECAIKSDAFIDSFNNWPHYARSLSDMAVKRLTDKHPEATIAQDRAYCLRRGDDRFPESFTTDFVLVREVKLDRPVVVEGWA